MTEQPEAYEDEASRSGVGPGTRIRGCPNGAVDGVMGALVSDLRDPEGGRVYAVTSRSVAPPDDLVSALDGRQVGKTRAVRQLTNNTPSVEDPSAAPAWELLTFVELKRGVLVNPEGLPHEVREGAPDAQESLTEDPVAVLGERVANTARAGDDPTSSATLKQAEACFTMTDPDGLDRLYEGAAIVHADEDATVGFARSTEVGAGVVSVADGRLIGLVVAGNPRQTVLAPVHDLFAHLSFAPLTRRQALAYNRTQYSPERVYEQVYTDLCESPERWEQIFAAKQEAIAKRYAGAVEVDDSGASIEPDHSSPCDQLFSVLFQPLFSTPLARIIRADMAEPALTEASLQGREAFLMTVGLLSPEQIGAVQEAFGLPDGLTLHWSEDGLDIGDPLSSVLGSDGTGAGI